MAPQATAWVLVYLHFKASYVANITNTSGKNFFSDNLTFPLQYFVCQLINVLNLSLVPNLSFLNFVFFTFISGSGICNVFSLLSKGITTYSLYVSVPFLN